MNARGITSGLAAEEGSISLFVAALALAILAMAGLVYDGGTKLINARSAADTAAEAARAGADEVDLGTLRGSGSPGVDATAAATAARAYLAQAGVTGTATADGTTAVTVTVTITQQTTLLQLVGIATTTATGTATATLEHGVTQEEP